ncbi:alpha/beta fold hydrolase [Streptomyces sp. NPDC046862]|uniref:alpha/beta fold hydrolase n=1 Tax=Streptomyces sp. NPDC046862 TaxID=3154603 RepID=UPI0034556C0C
MADDAKNTGTGRDTSTDTGTSSAAAPSRRHALRRLTAVAGGAAVAVGLGTGVGRATDHGGARGQGQAQAQGQGRGRRGVRTYVLVHGTHSAGTFWAAIGRELALRGHRVVAVDQPLHGTERFVPEAYQAQDLRALATEPSPLAALTLDDFARRVTNTVRRAARLGGPVVLVGHSMGGVSVSRVADAVPELLAHICYMAAFCPSRTMPSLNDCAASPEGQRAINPVEQVIGDPEKLGVLRLNWRTSNRRDLALFKEMICANYTDAAFLRVLEGMQTDESLAAYAGRAVGRAGTWGRIPRTYLRMGKDRTVSPELQDRMIAEADALTPDNRFTVHDFPGAGHLGPSDPAPLVDLLHGLPVTV